MRRVRLSVSVPENQIKLDRNTRRGREFERSSGNLAWLWAWIRTVQALCRGNFTAHESMVADARAAVEKPKRTCACRSVSIWNLFRMRSHWGGKYWNYIG